LLSTVIYRTVRTGQHDDVALRITQPALPVGVLTAMARFDDVSFHLLRPRHNRVEIIQFKPKENAISVRSKIGIPEWTVMVFDAPMVQLEDQRSVRDQSLVIRPTVAALTAKETLIPATARLDVVHANERL